MNKEGKIVLKSTQKQLEKYHINLTNMKNIMIVTGKLCIFNSNENLFSSSTN